MAKFTKDTFETSPEFSRDCRIAIEVLEKVHTEYKDNINKASKAVYDAVDDIDRTSAAFDYLLDIVDALSMSKKDRLIVKFNKLKCLYDDVEYDEDDEDALIEYDSLEQKIVDRIKSNVENQRSSLLFNEMQRLKAIYRIKNMTSIEEVFDNFPLQFENVLRSMFGSTHPDGTFSTAYPCHLELTSTLEEMIDSCIQYVFVCDKYIAYNTITKILSVANVTVQSFDEWKGADVEDESDSDEFASKTDLSKKDSGEDQMSEKVYDQQLYGLHNCMFKKVYEQLNIAYNDGDTEKYKKLNEILIILMDV